MGRGRKTLDKTQAKKEKKKKIYIYTCLSALFISKARGIYSLVINGNHIFRRPLSSSDSNQQR